MMQLGMMKSVVTLYVDETSIRLLVAGRKGVRKWAERPLDAGMVADGVIVQEAEVAARVKELLAAERVSARKVIAGLSGLHCLSRVIGLPRLPKALLGEAVNREAQRVIPVPLDQLYLAWQAIPGEGTETRVFLVALPRNAADSLVRTLRQAGVAPYLMDLKPLALARLADRDTAVIADIQETEVDIIVIVDRVPQLMRTIPVPPEGRAHLKKLSVVEEELDRTIKFYNSSHPEQPLAPDIPVLVSGELAKESTAEPRLTEMKPLAVARDADQATAVVADIQAAQVDIVVLVDKVPQLMRTIPLPAEAGLRAEKLASLEEEIDRTLKFYNSSHPDQPLSPGIPVLISGEAPGESTGESAGGPSPARTAELKSAALPLSSPLALPAGFDPVRYMVNIGLAMKELAPRGANLMSLNALPEPYRPRPPSLREAVFVPSAIVATALLIPLLVLVQTASAHTGALRTQLEATTRVNKERQVQRKELADLKKKVDEVVAARDAASKLRTYFDQSQANMNRDLSTATSLLNVGVTMSGLSHSGDRLTVNGTAFDDKAVLDYAASLRESKRFSQVIVANISIVKGEMVFRLVLVR